jgi:MoaA/NifB/PqqE/SkfB family radical SAM enzyme
MGVDRLNIQPIHTNLRHREKPHEAYSGLLLEKKDLPEFEREFSKFQRASKQKAISNSFLNGIPDYFHGKAKCQACHAGYISCAIDANGGVSACDDMPPVAYVRDMPLEKIWKSDEFHIQRRKVDRCHANCWDTTHANLNILLSPKTAIAEIGTLYSIVKYHLS